MTGAKGLAASDGGAPVEQSGAGQKRTFRVVTERGPGLWQAAMLSRNSRFECDLFRAEDGRWRWRIFRRVRAGGLHGLVLVAGASGRGARYQRTAIDGAIRAWRRLRCWRAKR